MQKNTQWIRVVSVVFSVLASIAVLINFLLGIPRLASLFIILIAALILFLIFAYVYIKSIDNKGLKIGEKIKKRLYIFKMRIPNKNLKIIEVSYIIYSVMIIVIYVFLISEMAPFVFNTSVYNYNGQLVNFAGSGGNYTTSPSDIVSGNAIGGNLTIIYVGDFILNRSDYIPVRLNFGVYPGIQQINVTFSPLYPITVSNAMLNGNSSFLSKGNYTDGMDGFIVTSPKYNFLPAGEYILSFHIVSNSTEFKPSKTSYHLLNIGGELKTSQNFIYNFKIYLKVYPNMLSFCNSLPSLC